MATPGLSPELLTAATLTAPVRLANYLVALPVVVPLLFASGLLMMRGRLRWQPAVAIAGMTVLLVINLLLLRRVASEGPQVMMMGAWKPPFGIAFTADRLGVLFACAAAVVALACTIHAAATVSLQERRYGFFPFLFVMIGGVSGAFLTGDLFNLYVWFEVLLIGSFGLIVLGSEHRQLDGATKYCFLNLIATTFFLVATGLVYGLFGTLNMADIAMKARSMEPNGEVVTIATLMLVAFGMKAAAFPLNNWLPASYHTPRFVVSALFAGLLTKVGVYALIRVLLMLFPAERGGLSMVVAGVAAATMIVGALGALAQSDLRRFLNYLVIAGIGTILAGLALPLPLSSEPTAGPLQAGLSGAIFYAVHSMVVMTALYLAASLMTRRADSASLHEIGGLWRSSPLLAAVTLVLLIAVSGLPPFSGFWPKLMLVQAMIGGGMGWLAAVILLSGFLQTIACARLFALAFWRPAPAVDRGTDEPGAMAAAGVRAAAVSIARVMAEGRSEPSMLPLLVLALLAVAIGLWPQGLASLTGAAAGGILDPAGYHLSVFGGAS
ncbi:Na+/H+ antiporter subunit D [Mangrovicella endophytica]|uniref:Na+/H+ antiporter subunit D n=1 Tax=Mangrovicella endophytica TaxID=2066697 RepID=UPI000C9E6E60|nr:Na+/H+ antiporter subunit D [Mangrovicella endophytica]